MRFCSIPKIFKFPRKLRILLYPGCTRPEPGLFYRNRNFVQNRNVVQKFKFCSKVQILFKSSKVQSFCWKIEILFKNLNFIQKSIFCSKIEILLKIYHGTCSHVSVGPTWCRTDISADQAKHTLTDCISDTVSLFKNIWAENEKKMFIIKFCLGYRK